MTSDPELEGLRAGIYCRFSRDDGDDESDSISNQKLIGAQYCSENGLIIYDVYVDNNWSGAYSNRPDFQRILKDARENNIDVVVCKSQSRFSRDNALINKLFWDEFPQCGIFFIGVTDSSDTRNRKNKKTMQVKSMVDEWYLDDGSESVKNTLLAKKKDGQFCVSHVPYGYLKDPSNNKVIIVDQKVVWIIRFIFDCYKQGNGYKKIADKLSEKKVPTPIEYFRSIGVKLGRSLPKRWDIWSQKTIANILKNPIYAGTYYLNKYQYVSLKSKKRSFKNKSQWIPFNVEPIIDLTTWETVQREISYRSTNCGQHRCERKTKYGGVLRCGDCGSPMQYHPVKYTKNLGGKRGYPGDSTQKENIVIDEYVCQTYVKRGKQYCISHHITISELDDALAFFLKEIYKMAIDVNSVMHEIAERNKSQKQYDTFSVAIDAKNKRLWELQRLMDCLYEDYRLKGEMVELDYKRRDNKYREEIEDININLIELEELRKKEEKKVHNSKDWRSIVERYKDISPEHIDRMFVLQHIDHIEVFADKSVVIHLNNDSPFQQLEGFLNNMTKQDLDEDTMNYLRTSVEVSGQGFTMSF